MSEPFLIFGHRGSPRRFRENTIESFEEALRSGADGFETDLRILADQLPVLYHDDELEERVIETLSVSDFTASGRAVVPLAQLAPFAGRTKMVLEVKRGRWEKALLKAIADWPGIIVASFDHSLLAELRRLGARFEIGITVFGYPVDLAAYAATLGATWCFPAYRYVDKAMVTSLHGAGVKVVPWTPNRVVEWAELRELGCDGMITDLPGEAVEWRRSGS
jgi:glycerophosphoryl diester phosphodiesterase